MAFYLRLEQFLAVGTEAFERVDLILFHQPTVADHIGDEDGGQVTMGRSFAHGAQLFPGNPLREDSIDGLMRSLLGKDVGLGHERTPARTP